MPRGIFRRKIDIEAAAFGTARIGHFSVEHRIYRVWKRPISRQFRL